MVASPSPWFLIEMVLMDELKDVVESAKCRNVDDNKWAAPVIRLFLGIDFDFVLVVIGVYPSSCWSASMIKLVKCVIFWIRFARACTVVGSNVNGMDAGVVVSPVDICDDVDMDVGIVSADAIDILFEVKAGPPKLLYVVAIAGLSSTVDDGDGNNMS
jgi:hypothetical protein